MLLTRRDDEGDHASSVAPGRLQGLDQLLHFPDFNILIRRLHGCVSHSAMKFFFKYYKTNDQMKMQSAEDPELCVFDEQFSSYKF
jgi:hypothetical protein